MKTQENYFGPVCILLAARIRVNKYFSGKFIYANFFPVSRFL